MRSYHEGRTGKGKRANIECAVTLIRYKLLRTYFIFVQIFHVKRTVHFLHTNYLTVVLSALTILCLTACDKTEVFEKNKSIPKHQWAYNLQPTFDFTITDTSALYNLYIVLRHTDAYHYNNISEGYEIVVIDDLVRDMFYGPTAKDSRFSCGSKRNR